MKLLLLQRFSQCTDRCCSFRARTEISSTVFIDIGNQLLIIRFLRSTKSRFLLLLKGFHWIFYLTFSLVISSSSPSFSSSSSRVFIIFFFFFITERCAEEAATKWRPVELHFWRLLWQEIVADVAPRRALSKGHGAH